jgi:hypothetical protein
MALSWHHGLQFSRHRSLERRRAGKICSATECSPAAFEVILGGRHDGRKRFTLFGYRQQDFDIVANRG